MLRLLEAARVTAVASGRAASALSGPFDLAIIDLTLGDTRGDRVLAELRARGALRGPAIVATGRTLPDLLGAQAERRRAVRVERDAARVAAHGPLCVAWDTHALTARAAVVARRAHAFVDATVAILIASVAQLRELRPERLRP